MTTVLDFKILDYPTHAAILPVAMVTSVCREVLAEAGFDANLVSMVADTREEPATMGLLEHPATAIVDFTGSPSFGRWIEQHCSDKLVYTETAGCNSVVIESTDAGNDSVLHSLTSAAAETWTIMKPELTPASSTRNRGRPERELSTIRANRRSEIDARSVTVMAR